MLQNVPSSAVVIGALRVKGQFKDVFNKNEHSQVPFLDMSVHFMDTICVSKKGVTKLLKGLNPSKASGPDELHSRVMIE